MQKRPKIDYKKAAMAHGNAMVHITKYLQTISPSPEVVAFGLTIMQMSIQKIIKDISKEHTYFNLCVKSFDKQEMQKLVNQFETTFIISDEDYDKEKDK